MCLVQRGVMDYSSQVAVQNAIKRFINSQDQDLVRFRQQKFTAERRLRDGAAQNDTLRLENDALLARIQDLDNTLRSLESTNQEVTRTSRYLGALFLAFIAHRSSLTSVPLSAAQQVSSTLPTCNLAYTLPYFVFSN